MSKRNYRTKITATGTVVPMDWEKRAATYLELLRMVVESGIDIKNQVLCNNKSCTDCNLVREVLKELKNTNIKRS